MGRFFLALLPLTTFVIVGVLVLWIGAPRSVGAIRLWGGPTDRIARFSGWVEAELDGRPLAGEKLRLSARPIQGKPASVTATLDADGRAELLLDFERAPQSFELAVESERGELGRGRVELSAQRWLDKAGRRGGFSRVQSQTGALAVQIAPARGAFAVPFPGELWVRVARDGVPVAHAKLQLKSDGARVRAESGESNAQGLARFSLTPNEHIVTARVSVVAPDGARAELFSSVPIVPGAILVEPEGAALRVPLQGLRSVVRSPVERSVAFVAVVSEQGRWFGARVPLSPVGDGTAAGTLQLPELPNEPIWVVVRSEPSAPSSASVGWPLFESAGPALTLDVPDSLLLDTGPLALAREHERRRGIRRIALGVGLAGALVSVLALAWATLRQRKQLSSHLSAELGPAESSSLLPRERARSIAVIVLIILGFFAIVAIAAWRLA